MSRDSNVHTVSIVTSSVPAYVASAPAGQWTKISTNTVFDVKFTGWGANGYPADLGNYPDLYGGWMGGAYDPARLTIYYHGGGHAGYNGNEFYAFRLALNQFERVNNPSPYIESQQVNGLLPDGLPQPVHGYGEMECDANGYIYNISNGGSPIQNIWRFNPNQAARPFTYNPDTLAAFHNTGQPVSVAYGGGFCYDAPSNTFYGGSIPSDFWNGRKYNVTTNSSTPLTDFPPNGFAPGLEPSVCIDTLRRKMFVVGGYDAPPSGAVHRGTVVYDIAADTWANLTPTTTGDKTPEITGGGGLTYDSRRDKLWWWQGTPTTKDIFRFDYTTKVWTKITPAGSTPVIPFQQGTFNKLRYIAAYDVFVVMGGNVDTSLVEIWMYKPADWMA